VGIRARLSIGAIERVRDHKAFESAKRVPINSAHDGLPIHVKTISRVVAEIRRRLHHSAATVAAEVQTLRRRQYRSLVLRKQQEVHSSTGRLTLSA
jgi:hypothetical protein